MGKVWLKRRVELARQRIRAGFDLGQAMRQWELTLFLTINSRGSQNHVGPHYFPFSSLHNHRNESGRIAPPCFPL
jgi:hypothetical protein